MKNKFKRITLMSTSILSLSSIAALSAVGCSCSGQVIDETLGQLVYKTNADNTVTVTGLVKYNNKITKIVVPNEIDGKKVSSIAKGAFTKCPSLASITLPFIGKSNGATNEEGLFGYVFGEDNYDGCGGATWQEYDVLEGDAVETQTVSYCIPMSLEKVTITNTDSISSGAFSNCKYLEDIIINKHDEEIVNSRAFKGCIALNDFDFTCLNGLKTIGEHAFESCETFQYLSLPSTVTTIEAQAFKDCDSCTTIRLDENITKVDTKAFNGVTGAILVPQSESKTSEWASDWIDPTGVVVYDFGSESSYGYTADWFVLVCGKGDNKYAYLAQWMSDWAQTELTVPKTIEVNGKTLDVKIIGGRCFQENVFLKHVKFEEGIEHIFSDTFEGCTNLEYVEFPTTLKTIENYAFANCSKLVGHYENHQPINKIILNNVTKIGNSAFRGCSSIQEIDFGSALKSIGEEAFAYCTHLCPDTTDNPDNCLRIPDTCESLGEGAFKYCFKYAPNSITTSSYFPTVVISNKLTEIPNNCFEWCGVRNQKPTEGWDKGVQYPKQIRVSINLNDTGLKRIGDYAFNNCWIAKLSGARDTHIKYIGDYAFYYAQMTSDVSPTSESKADLQMDQEIEYIGQYAFAYCTTVQSLTFNTAIDYEHGTVKEEQGYNSLKYLGQYAFYGCSNQDFTKLDLSPCVYLNNWSTEYAQEYLEPLCKDKPATPDNTAYRPYTPRYAFAQCTNLRNVYLPGDEQSPAAIGEKVTKSCTTFTRLPERFFEGCTNIGKDGSALTIPKQIVELRVACLNGLTYLTKAYVDGSLEYLGSSVFYNNQSIESIVAHKRDDQGKIITGQDVDVTFNSEIFNNYRVGSSIYYQCYKLTRAPMPTVKKGDESAVDFNIRDYMYYQNKALTTITLPWNAVSLGSRSFMGCESLTTLTFETRQSTQKSRMSTIYSYALNGCKSLTTINLEDTTVSNIYGSAFTGCNKLMKLVMPKRSVTFYTKPFEGWTPSNDTISYATIEFAISQTTRSTEKYYDSSAKQWKYKTWTEGAESASTKQWVFANKSTWPQTFIWAGNTADNNKLTFTKDSSGDYYTCDDNACGGTKIHFVPVSFN